MIVDAEDLPLQGEGVVGHPKGGVGRRHWGQGQDRQREDGHSLKPPERVGLSRHLEVIAFSTFLYFYWWYFDK